MHRLNDSALVVSSLLALLGAFACSSDSGGNNNGANGLGPAFGSQPSNSNTNSNANQPGAGGTSGVVGVTPNVEGNPAVNDVNNTPVSQMMGAAGSGGAATTTDVMPQEIPPSYFSFGSWHGSAWTYSDPATTRSAVDYSMLPRNSPFCLSGQVAPKADYSGVASIGFNINQAPFGDVPGQEPPKLEVTPTQAGVAVNYTKTAGQILRIQLQSLAGETSEDARWCAELTAVNGPAFVPYGQFRTRCWFSAANGSTPAQIATSTPYNREPIAAVVLTVPGDDIDPVPYDICVSGFADGNSAQDAPAGGSLSAGLVAGTMSGEAQRTKVTGTDGKDYIINNNAWGDNSGDGTQQIRYLANSFEVLKQSAGPGANDSPASFPSIYIGQNGAISGVNGASTTGNNPLPIRVSDIRALPSTFKISGPQSAQNNATYDIWFASSAPAPGSYNTAQAAFLMVWTHKPGSHNPIGNNNQAFATAQTVQGVPGTWDIWAGRRGGSGPDANLPVINYVVSGGDVTNFSADLKLFMNDAVARSGSGRLNGFTFSDQFFLTDVFAGFEIWSGGTGLKVDEFTAVINP